ncbi:hypothetical protein ASPVEDRAFT_311838 [Aspergillus versicolor CBS 583.65]|uniref:PH domain-containing protein n=1 Tax=Aspergillus versicolor CBS 583.65 TaxID=1036611 RepID=A0A1L9PX26_ASPVE|nr:uncharacterized protein ASPVEDRAFT_311838 [Aspergillus versicolor CBS 583.65]OJJ06100.1 hypothetical protein ASPVEDRAFT_311838 [Aspergillus versicolor CBS 583.65]
MATETQDFTGAGGQGPTPAKFSRYRSVRRAASTNATGMAPLNTSIPPVPTRQSTSASGSQDVSDWTGGTSTTIKKSMSRYRRQKPPTPSSADGPPPPPLPLPPQQHPVPRVQPAAAAVDDYSARRPFKDSHSSNSAKPRGRFIDAMRLDTRGRGLFGGNGNNLSDTDPEERERDRQAAMDSLTGGCNESPTQPSSRQRRATRGRAATDREAHRTADKRQAVDDAANRPHSHNEPKRKSFKDTMKFSRTKAKTTKAPSVDSGPDTNAPAIFPGIDAPVSAVNAGERTVVVQYKKDSLRLSVSPSTSAHEILVSASRSISEIDPPRFILMESFNASGLERPLRQYEYVREVMNSWAHDAENTLIIVPAPSIEALDFLDAQNVPTKPPMDATFHIYYSQKPRKWDKRYLTIRSDGQIVLSKKEMAKEQTNVCHLSDFDIYSPTSTFLTQKVKPPKKICYAIKSQQKSSMFLSTENFIHYFATNHRSVADGWYRAVQTWRSWYLVNKLGAGQSESSRTRQISLRRRSSREHKPPPSSFPKSLATEPEAAATNSADESPFAASGLLGRTYTHRQKAMKDREEREKREADVLFNQGLVSASGPPRQFSASRPGSRTNSMTSAHQPELDSLLKRSQSIKQGKPLVDLTPVYQEPPQHSRKGRGVTVDTGGPLIEAATGIESTGGIAIPPAKTWRRPTAPPPIPAEPPIPSSNEARINTRSNTVRSASNRYRHGHNTTTAPSSPTTPPDIGLMQEQAFAPNSLLARTGSGNLPPGPGAPIGHGVATGDRNATKPMLDVKPQSPFAEGSLLRGL